MPKPIGSLSLDLDNRWSYLKTHGSPAWQDFPSYLDTAVPQTLDILAEFQLRITYFVIGQDAALAKNQTALQKIANAGHEIANHSFHHEPWLQRYSESQLVEELESSQAAIQSATGQQPHGFRGPGFSLSRQTLRTLSDLGFTYDCSTFPTFIGPLARLYCFWSSRLDADQQQDRADLFGTWRDGLRSLRPYQWQVDEQRTLLELPVSTIPLLRAPFHLSYLLFLRRHSNLLALLYFRFALTMCRLRGVEPSLLLHPTDFLGRDDEPELHFFPAMDLPGEQKRRFVRSVLRIFTQRFQVLAMDQYAELVQSRRLPVRSLDDLAV